MRRGYRVAPESFGCAAELYRCGVHPRMLLGPEDIARLRRQVRHGDGLRIFNAVRERVAPIVARLLAADTPHALDALLDPSQSWASFISQVDNAIHEMAMVAVLADDERALAAARRMLVEASPERRRFFFGYHAYAYDLLHDHLPADARLRYAAEQLSRARQLVEPVAKTYYANAGLNGVLVHMFIAMHLVVTVDDINKANDFHEFWWTLNTCPENTFALHEPSATITGWRRGNHLDVHAALPAPEEYPRPHALTMVQDEPTTSSYGYIKNPRERAAQYVRPAAMVEGIVFVRPRLVAKVAGHNGRFMVAMLPRLKGEEPAKVERLASLPSSLAMRIAWERVEDTLVWVYEHNLLEAGAVRGVGRWCVIRRSRSTGRVLAWALGAGTRLTVDGKRLL